MIKWLNLTFSHFHIQSGIGNYNHYYNTTYLLLRYDHHDILSLYIWMFPSRPNSPTTNERLQPAALDGPPLAVLLSHCDVMEVFCSLVGLVQSTGPRF